MKNSYTVVLVVIGVVSTAIFMNTKGQNDIVPSEEVTSINFTVKDNLVNEVARKSQKSVPNKNVVIKLSESNSADAEFESGDNNDKPSFVIGKSKALNSNVIRQYLEMPDFQSVITNLSQFQTQAEIEREYELVQAINDESNLSAYPYSYSCGGGICAVELSDISNKELINVNDFISNTMNFKAIITHTIATPGGKNKIRVIGGSSSDAHSITLNSVSHLN